MYDRTFIIDSNNLSKVKSKLFGYMITDDGDIYIDKIPNNISDTGLFSLIEKKNNKIIIRQDFCASFGLFLYKKDDYFIISNSFMKLLENINDKLTINKNVFDSILYVDDAYILNHDTLVKEIYKLSSDEYINIDINTKVLNIEKKDYLYYKRRFDCIDSFDLLDNWYFKWIKVFRNMVKNNYPITCDLSGGLDTRVILSMLRNANIDINSSIKMQSHTKVNLDKDKEDMRISEEIASDLGIELNSDKSLKMMNVGSLSIEDVYSSSKYTSFGSSNLTKYSKNLYKDTFFSIKGIGSTTKGGFWHRVRVPIRYYTKRYGCYKKKNGILDMASIYFKKNRIKLYYKRVVSELLKGYKHEESHKATLLYKKMMIENRDSLKALDWMSGNNIIVSPFFDPLIAEFDYNPYNDDILYLNTLILDRYDSTLLKYDIEGRVFNSNTLKNVHILNNKYPVEKKKYSKLKKKQIVVERETLNNEELGSYLENIYKSGDFKDKISKYIDEETYNYILNNTDKNKINMKSQPINNLLTLYEVLKNIN